jgi:hypothetical protein
LFAWARLLATVVHVVEFSFLLHVFRSKGVLTSLAVQNSCVLLSGVYWGCLEILRTRVRTAHSKNAAAREVGAWIHTAVGLAVCVLAVPSTVVALRVVLLGEPFRVLDLYALICALRLGLDLPLRTYYSGVYARYRVARPALAIVLFELSGLATILVSWRWLGSWSFPLGLLLSVLVSRGFTFYVTRRAYRLLRLPAPHGRASWHLRARPSELVSAGLAGAATRLGPLLVLALVWGRHRGQSGFVLLVHLLAPLLSATASWPQVFYLDFKRLEHDACLALRRRLQAQLVPLSLLVGVGLWVLGVVTGASRTAPSALTIAIALLPVFLTQSYLAGLQLSHLARGELHRLSLNAVVVMVGLVVATALTVGSGARTLAVTGVLALAIVHLGVVRARPRRVPFGRKDSVAAWLGVLTAVREPVSVSWASVPKSRGRELEVLASWLEARLGAAGALAVVRGRWLIWSQPTSVSAPLTKAELVAASGGLIETHEQRVANDGAPLAVEVCRSLAWVRGPTARSDAEVGRLVATFQRLFPAGCVADLHDPRTCAQLATYTPRQRQDLWLDALRHATGRRGQLADMDVSTLSCAGEIRLIFVVSKLLPREERRSWKALLATEEWSEDQSLSKGPMSTGVERALPVKS